MVMIDAAILPGRATAGGHYHLLDMVDENGAVRGVGIEILLRGLVFEGLLQKRLLMKVGQCFPRLLVLYYGVLETTIIGLSE